jgi:N-acetylmuramoyl-L-alanine amidase
MSANPTRVDWEATSNDPGSPLQEGNRVLESIAQKEALRALLAFADLHEQIRNRHNAAARDSASDLFETERFILDEVLQLICDRAQSITRADGIAVALAAGPALDETEASGIGIPATKDNGPELAPPDLICRASAGPLAVNRGVHLIGESEFLQDCLDSGRILRCDDCEIDARVELDFSRAIGARSTVLVPLRGRREQLGVLQAFSTTAWAFTDHDIRCFDLFAELLLSALKPEDQDRRIYWLSDVADEVLRAKPAAALPVVAAPIIAAPIVAAPTVVAPTIAAQTIADTAAIEVPEIAPSIAPSDIEKVVAPSPAATTLSATPTAPAIALPVPDVTALAQPVIIPAAIVELPESMIEAKVESKVQASVQTSVEHKAETRAETNVEIKADTLFENETQTEVAPLDLDLTGDSFEIEEIATPSPKPRILPFLQRLPLPISSRPGLSVVLGLIVVAGLFSAGAWWGMQVPGKTAGTKTANANSSAETSPPLVTTTPLPPADVLSPAVSDNLMNPEKLGSEAAPLGAVAENKLAALPKVTGVRHWSSSMGSTVVIDMEDQVPYEVHRLVSPDRIYFDLHDTVLTRDLDGKTMDVGDPSLTRVRIAQPVAGVTRVVLDTRDGSNFSVSMESNPYRLVVELRGIEKTFAKSSLPPSPMKANPATANAAPAANTAPTALAKASDQPVPARTGKFRIVLDAGHGGWDLGTVGRQGLMEKDLVLDVTQRLGKLLQARLGSEVMFTRTGDTYLPLDQRADIANQAQADLFVSVHANYSSSAAARGVETYYTNLFSAPGSREVEKHEDGTFSKLTPVSLSPGALHDKIEESQRLASSVQRSLYATLAANSPDIRNRGIKDSAFAVLTGTTMPAILTEISFVSSPADEHNLQSAAYRQQIAEALYQGIARYQQSSPHAKVAQLQKPATRQ